MAIRERGGKYQVYWNNPFTGKRESVTLPTQAEAQKKDALIKYELQFEREKFRPQDVVPVAPKTPSANGKTLEDVYYLYLKEKKFNRKGMQWQLNCMKEALEVFGLTPVTSITYQQLCQFKADLLDHDEWKQTTVRSKLSVLRTVLRWAYDREYIEYQARFPKLPPAEYEKFVPPTPEELERIIAVSAPHIIRMIVIGCQFGVRVGRSELFRLKWSDVDIFRRVIRVPAAHKNPNEPWREVPIREALIGVIGKWQQEDVKHGIEYVINYDGHQVQNIFHGWRGALRRAGITRNIRPYDLRHAFATWAIKAGTDAGTVAKLMGHTSTTMVFKHYQHVLTEQKVQAVESLPDVIHVPRVMCQK